MHPKYARLIKSYQLVIKIHWSKSQIITWPWWSQCLSSEQSYIYMSSTAVREVSLVNMWQCNFSKWRFSFQIISEEKCSSPWPMKQSINELICMNTLKCYNTGHRQIHLVPFCKVLFSTCFVIFLRVSPSCIVYGDNVKAALIRFTYLPNSLQVLSKIDQYPLHSYILVHNVSTCKMLSHYW